LRLPPLNGFISEFLIYLGFFSGIGADSGAARPFLALAAPSLALIGGLAVACFIKVYGIAFLGMPRTPEAAAAHEAGWAMRGPMMLLAGICGFIGMLLCRWQHAGQAAIAWQQASQRMAEVCTPSSLGWLTFGSMICWRRGGTCFHFRLAAFGSVSGSSLGTAAYLRPAPA